MKKLIFITALAAMLAACGGSDNTGDDKNNLLQKESASAVEISAEIEKDPDNAELYYRRANIYFDEKYLDRALADIDQALVLSPDAPVYLFQKGRILYAMNRTIDASKNYEKAISLKPDFREAQLKLIELYYIVKEHKKSNDLCNVILAQEPANTKALYYKGMNYRDLHDTALAINAFQKAYEFDDKYYDAVIQLGNLYAGLNNKIALDYYISAARISPKSPEPAYSAGVFLQKQKDYRKAIGMYEQALKADPEYYQAYYNSAIINTELARYKDAIDNLNTVIRLAPGFADAYYMKGLCNEALGNLNDARANYEYTLEVDPEHALAKKAIKALK